MPSHSLLKYAASSAALVFILIGAGVAQTGTAAQKEFARLKKLSAALNKIPINRQDKEPHRSFLKANDKDIVYSEPAGQWFVRSERFWDLQKKYPRLPLADQIAWAAANNPTPGECEGFVNCYVYLTRATYGEYLGRYPNGRYLSQAVDRISRSLTTIAGELDKGVFDPPTDPSDKAELRKMLAELGVIVKNSKSPKAQAVIEQIDRLSNRYN